MIYEYNAYANTSTKHNKNNDSNDEITTDISIGIYALLTLYVQ